MALPFRDVIIYVMIMKNNDVFFLCKSHIALIEKCLHKKQSKANEKLISLR